MAVFMWRWVYGSLDADEYDTIEAAARAEGMQDGEWSCAGIEVIEAGVGTWMPRDEPNSFRDALDAEYERQSAARREQAQQDRERPVTGIVRVAAPVAPDFEADRFARMEWVHDASEEAAVVDRFAGIFGADRVSVERPRVPA